MFDQFFWAEKVEWLGVGPPALPVRPWITRLWRLVVTRLFLCGCVQLTVIMPDIDVDSRDVMLPEACDALESCVSTVTARLKAARDGADIRAACKSTADAVRRETGCSTAVDVSARLHPDFAFFCCCHSLLRAV